MSRLDAEQLIFREARLADEGRYEEWLSLWTKDAIYWVPSDLDDPDPRRHVSLIYDNRSRLEGRVARLISGTVLAQDPKPRMRRVISNLEIESTGDTEIKVESNFVLVEARGSSQSVWCGRSIHLLSRQEERLKIAHKTVLLVNAGQEMPVLQFLV